MSGNLCKLNDIDIIDLQLNANLNLKFVNLSGMDFSVAELEYANRSSEFKPGQDV